MNWKHGYYADSGYTYGWYVETMPVRLQWAALIQGHKTQKKNFRYLDAGCGQGLSLILAAAAHPDSEFVGIDFLPEHIAHAKMLADRAGLKNVTFVEGDFIDLAENFDQFGSFDYAVCHGISTWISPVVRSSLYQFIGKALNPGGVFYNSYNCFPGWLPVVPFQHLVLLEQRTKGGPNAIKSARAIIDRLQNNAPNFFGHLPGLTARLKGMDTQDPAYLVQEYNNQFWQPMFVSQMIDALMKEKLNYLGTATLPEAYDAVLTQEARELIAEQSTSIIKEQIRDYALNQNFRRDLYVKGQLRPWLQEHGSLLKNERFIVNPITVRPKNNESFPIKAGLLELNGDGPFYGWIIDFISNKKTASIAELVEAQPNGNLKAALPQAVSMLLHGNWVLPYQETNALVAKTLNDHIIGQRMLGAPYNYLCLPKTGCSISLTDIDAALISAFKSNLKVEHWKNYVLETMKRLGKAIAKDGQALTNENEIEKVVSEKIVYFNQVYLPFLKLSGAI